MKKNIIISLFLLVAIFFQSCEKQKDQNRVIKKEYSLDDAKLISGITTGIIAPNGKIVVKFQKKQVKENRLNIALATKVFHFTPNIDGLSKWEDERTLVFTPNRKLDMRQKFIGHIDLETLFRDVKNLKTKQLPLGFEISGREILDFQAKFELTDKNNANLMNLTGFISFTEPTTLDIVKKSFSILKKNKKVDFELSEENSSKYKFIIKSLKREMRDYSIKVLVDNKDLELSSSKEFTYTLPSVSDFKITEIKNTVQNKSLFVAIKFSDEIAKGKDYNGFINITPLVKTKLKVNHDKIIVSGNFEHGKKYIINVEKGIKSKWGTILNQKVSKKVYFRDVKPQMTFLQSGAILPSSNHKKIEFKTINVKNINVKVEKVFPNNLTQFLQEENLLGSKNKRESYYGINRVGKTVYSKKLDLKCTKNQWLVSELDLKNIIKNDKDGIFIISLSFRKDDMLWKIDKEYSGYYNDDYYSNPSSSGYLYSHGRISKPVIVSDIGIISKISDGKKILVYTSDILSSKPMSSVTVNLIDYRNQIIATKTSDNDGKCEFNSLGEKSAFYIEAVKNNQKSIMKLSDSKLNTSTFDVGGIQITKSGLKGFTYSDRGVYRPGDKINLSIIIRDKTNSFPANQPVKLKIVNPKNQKIFETTNTKGKDGFYSFSFSTKDNDYTGEYMATFDTGTKNFHHSIKVETIVPYKLKVNIKPEKENISKNDEKLKFTVNSKYLFGTPAKNHRLRVNLQMSKGRKRFKSFRNYTFSDKTFDFASINNQIFSGNLDNNGNKTISWSLPKFTKLPSAVNMSIQASVLEKGGRPVRRKISLDYETYKNFVGIETPESTWLKIGSDANFNVVIVDNKGKMVPGKQLKYKLYRNQYYWWYNYDEESSYKKRYKSDFETSLVKEGSFVSKNQPFKLNIKPEERGQLLLEVTDVNGGHTASIFFGAFGWGDEQNSKDAHVLKLKADKKSYISGQTAKIAIKTPQKGNLLLSVEKGNTILYTKWIEVIKDETVVEVPISEEMTPNIYVSAILLQPHSQTKNDRPIRMFGILPITVEKKGASIFTDIKTDKFFRPNKDFSVEIQTIDKTQAQFTIAIVDEGILDITNFITPDPKNLFYKKEMLSVYTYDLFSNVIGINSGEATRLFSVGGGVYNKAKKRSPSIKANRFKPIAIFKGPILTDEKGYAKIKLKMGDYVGSVRIMVIGTKNERYIKEEKTVPVKTELMLVPSLPRIIGPKEEFEIPVSVFGMQDSIGKVKVSLSVSGPLEIKGEASKTLTFTKKDEKELFFKINTKGAIGKGIITIKAVSDKFSAVKKTEIAVRPSSPYMAKSTQRILKKDNKVSLSVPDGGIKGSNYARVTISKRPKLKLNHRIKWLIRYPYGCVEQTTSAVFPQLFLKNIFCFNDKEKEKMDININAGINRLRRFQTRAGGFGYWPGDANASIWGTNYAGHFLVEAQKMGYNVPSDIYENWLHFQTNQALSSSGSFLERTYRLYVLALAGKPNLGPMNLLKENSLKTMKNPEKWLLAGAYKLAGMENVSKQIIAKSDFDVDEYTEFSGSYGSTLRDKAIILEVITLFKQYNKALPLYKEIIDDMSDSRWYSTQTTAYCLLSLGKYITATATSDTKIKGSITLSDGSKIDIDTDNEIFILPLKDFGKKIEVENNSEISLFAVMEWEGISLKERAKSESKNLKLKVEWLSEDGSVIDPKNLKQGSTFYGHINVKAKKYSKAKEIALTQIIPSGWEIENMRLSNQSLPDWVNKKYVNKEEYKDIKDDRISWFFDFNGYYNQGCDFYIKINTVTKGKFFLPPTVVQAMYNNNYRAVNAGGDVQVK